MCISWRSKNCNSQEPYCIHFLRLVFLPTFLFIATSQSYSPTLPSTSSSRLSCHLPSISSTLSPHSPLPRPSHLKTALLTHPIKRNSRARLSSRSGIKLNIIRQLHLLSRQITVISSLSGLDLDTEDLSCELQDLVLYLAVLFLFR